MRVQLIDNYAITRTPSTTSGSTSTMTNSSATGAVTENNLLSSADLSDGYKTITDPEESISLCEPSLHSRDNQHIHSIDQRNDQKEKNDNNKDEPSPMAFDDSNKADDENNKPDDKTEGKPRKINGGHYYKPLVYYKGNKDKTYYYQYFKPYSYDFRMCKRMRKKIPLDASVPEVTCILLNAHGTILTLFTVLTITMIFLLVN